MLQTILDNLNIKAVVKACREGIVLDRFILELAPKQRLNGINSALNDIALALKVDNVRLIIDNGEVILEVPSAVRETIKFNTLINNDKFINNDSELPLIIGVDVEGGIFIDNLAKAPHVLIAGTTGSGKSVGMHSLLCSLLHKFAPDKLHLILIDPKMIELSMYENTPHLIFDVITDMAKAKAVLEWLVYEMERRYSVMEALNSRVSNEPYIVCAIDEFADLIMQFKDIESTIIRIAQKARACRIHLIMATQRPSADVVTGLIKANIPTRLCYRVLSNSNSRIVLDQGGAERLLGKGDSLYMMSSSSKLNRIQGAFVTDNDIKTAVSVHASATQNKRLNIFQLVDNVSSDTQYKTPAWRKAISWGILLWALYPLWETVKIIIKMVFQIKFPKINNR